MATLPPIEQLCWLDGSGRSAGQWRRPVGEVEVEHARLDPGRGVGVDREDPVHLRRDDDHRAVEGHGAAGQPGARPTGDERRRRGGGRPARRPVPPRWRSGSRRPTRALHVRAVAPVEASSCGSVARTGPPRRAAAPARRPGTAARLDEGELARTSTSSSDYRGRMAEPVAPEDLHEWLSFEDPDEDRTWVFDVTFLPRVDVHLRPRLPGRPDRSRRRARARLLQLRRPLHRRRRPPARSRRPPRAADRPAVAVPQASEEAGRSSARTTTEPAHAARRVGRASSSTGPASPAASAARCTSARWRPASGRSTGSPTSAGSSRCASRRHRRARPRHSTVREWKRRDWGEGGHEFHWWCTDAPEAFVGHEPVYRYLEDELVELVGRPVYDLLVGSRVGTGRKQGTVSPTRPFAAEACIERPALGSGAPGAVPLCRAPAPRGRRRHAVPADPFRGAQPRLAARRDRPRQGGACGCGWRRG